MLTYFFSSVKRIKKRIEKINFNSIKTQNRFKATDQSHELNETDSVEAAVNKLQVFIFTSIIYLSFLSEEKK